MMMIDLVFVFGQGCLGGMSGDRAGIAVQPGTCCKAAGLKISRLMEGGARVSNPSVVSVVRSVGEVQCSVGRSGLGIAFDTRVLAAANNGHISRSFNLFTDQTETETETETLPLGFHSMASADRRRFGIWTSISPRTI
jgi:hypothetical protein